MGMNPDTNRLEPLDDPSPEQVKQLLELERKLKGKHRLDLVRPDGSPVPKTWSTFRLGEEVIIKDYTFRVAYIGETSLLFEPVGPVLVA
jgi:hypothetical protein